MSPGAMESILCYQLGGPHSANHTSYFADTACHLQSLYRLEGTEMAMPDSQKRELYQLLGEAFTLMAQGRPMDYAIASALSHQVWPFGMGDLERRITRAIEG